MRRFSTSVRIMCLITYRIKRAQHSECRVSMNPYSRNLHQLHKRHVGHKRPPFQEYEKRKSHY